MALDRESSGSISLAEFKEALSGKFVLESEQEAEALFTSLDTDGSNTIEYSEFFAATLPDNAKFLDDALRRMFFRFDLDGDGNLSRAELASVLGETGAASEIEDLFQEADKSGYGQLGYEEFLAVFQRPAEASRESVGRSDVA